MSVLLVKYCPKCNRIFPATSEFFYGDKRNKNGLYGLCKNCQNKSNQKYYEENKEKVSERLRKYREENPEKERERHRKYYEENREKINEYGRKYNKENNDRIKKYRLEWKEKNKELVKTTNALWQKNNKDKRANNEGKRRSMKLNQTPILTQEEKHQVEMIYKKAQELGKNWHVDHIKPLSKDGLHHPDNLQIVAKKYNLEKGSKLDFRLPLDMEVYKWVG